jgi:REP-associated tyrosine transposase
MARPLRLEFPGALYYISGRTRGRAAAFRDDKDREKFLSLLGTIGPEDRWRVHGYALLRSGYELLIETPAGGLSHGMRSLNGRYTQWFNRRRGREGGLFEGRYKSILVQKEVYLPDMARHVAWSPVREGLARRPEGWRWTNYRVTSGSAEAPAWLEIDWTLARFGRRSSAARVAYRRYIAAGNRVPSPLDEVVRQAYLGDRRFRARALGLLTTGAVKKKVRRRSRGPEDTSIGEIRRVVAREWGVTAARLRQHGGVQKAAAIYLARKMTPLSNIEIGEAFGVGEARVSSVVREIQEGSKRSLLPVLGNLRQKLSRHR